MAGWDRLSAHDVDALPLADDVRFRFEGDHGLALGAHSAQELRDWMRGLFERFPRLRVEVELMVIEGPPWAMWVATRYAVVHDGNAIYRGAQFTRVRWGQIVEERILPDTHALAHLVPG